MNDKKVAVITDFDLAEDYASDYLQTYFMGDPTPDVRVLMTFLAERYKLIKNNPLILEIGCGPVIYDILPLARYVSEIHMADYRNDSLEQVRKWKESSKDAHNWNLFTKYALMLEGIESPTSEQILQREQDLKNKITVLSTCDLRNSMPLGHAAMYSSVICCYATEQAATTIPEWEDVMSNLSSLLAPGGHLFTCAVGKCEYYILYDKNGLPKKYPVPKLVVENYQEILGSCGFDTETAIIKYHPLQGQESEGVFGVILVHARKKLS